MKYLFYIIPTLLVVISCTNDLKEEDPLETLLEPKIIEEYGYILNDFNVIRDTIRPGDTFGGILSENGVSQNKIYEVATNFKENFDVRKIKIGDPYVLLNSKDSLNQTQVFIYEKNKVDYSIIDFRDSINVSHEKKPVTYIEKEASGVITSSLSATMAENNLSPYMTDRLANIYAWTINFFQLQTGDNFKVIYSEKFISDTISGGLGEIKAAYFEHKGKPIYAFNFTPEDETFPADYYDIEAKNLKRAFLKSPIKFNYRISSKYNLNRRIAYYGYKVRPHRGTDFAANVGTPILATADGTVTKAERRGGNGIYVKIRHNKTYETQYLHMKKYNVKVGQYVRQGEVIGWVGMTGNTGGPHVCYRFWKNGKEVDPFKEDLPNSKPLESKYHEEYFSTIYPLKERLDCIKNY
ncbi:MAG: peptidoglycan DD-metalloendopeptidase family protein [Flavobacteriaceae bacterium]